MDAVVPADLGVAMFEMRRGVPHCLRWPRYSEPLIPAFNTHFNSCCPISCDREDRLLGPVAWAQHADTEYDCDFNRPLGIGYSLGFGFHDHVVRREIIFCVQLDRKSKGFSEVDVAALNHIRPPVERLFGLLRSAESAEVELFERLQHPEAAEKLSPRTVESHALHIYQKLGVTGRRQLSESLGRPAHTD